MCVSVIDSEMMTTIGFSKVWTYFALIYITRFLKMIAMWLLLWANHGYNYQLVAATRKSSVKSLGFMFGSIVLGHHVQRYLLQFIGCIVRLGNAQRKALMRAFPRLHPLLSLR